MKNEKESDYRKVKFAMLMLPLFFILFSNLTYAASKCGSDICDDPTLALEVGNWRVAAVIALAISALIIAIIFMVGKAISDESLVARSKDELNQLVFTTLIVVIIVVLVQFMCSSAIPQFLYGSNLIITYQEPDLIKTSCVYLEKLSEYMKSMFYKTFWIFFTANFGQAFVEEQWTKTLGEMYDLALSSAATLFSTMLTAYITTSAQIFLIQFIQYFALLYLLPAGIVLRSFLPFRRFGGALIGVAIGLFFFLPLLVTLNAVIMDSQFKMNLEIGNKCTTDSNCCSQVCKSGECQMKLGVAETCLMDEQCASGICDEMFPGKKLCIQCFGNEQACKFDRDCCKGFTCKKEGNANEGYCTLAKGIGEPCQTYWDCTSRVCYNGNCSLPLAAGSTCSKDNDCYSGKCLLPTLKCSDCNMSGNEIPMIISEGGQALKSGGAISDITQADPKTTASTNVFSAVWKWIVSLFTAMLQSVTIVVIAGIVLPLINLMILSIAIRELSAFFGAETDVSIGRIWSILG